MIPKLVKTEADYEAALKRIDELMNSEPDSPHADELELLATLVEAYEDKHFSIDLPDPVEAIKFRMEQAGLTRRDLIPYIGSQSKVSEVLSGKRPLSLRMIRALNRGLGIPAEVLLREPEGSLPDDLSDLEWSRFPVGEMYKRGWFPDFKGTLNDAKEHAEELIREFLNPLIKSKQIQNILYQRHVRRGSVIDDYSLIAWKARILITATSNRIPAYRKGTLTEEFARHLSKMSCFDEGPKLAKELLEKNGIHLITERHLPKTHIDGAAMLLPDGSPVIALTLRHDRLDNFWFCLFHELAHVANHLSITEYICFVDDLDEKTTRNLEKQADQWAADALIPPEIWHNAGVRRNFRSTAIQEFALGLGVHPAIVAGRIRWEQNNYRILARLVGNGQVRKHFFN